MIILIPINKNTAKEENQLKSYSVSHKFIHAFSRPNQKDINDLELQYSQIHYSSKASDNP